MAAKASQLEDDTRSSEGLERESAPVGPIPTSGDTGIVDAPPRVAGRVTVNLSRKSVEALNATVALTDDSKTEVINKALQVYREIRAAQERGGGVWLQNDGNTEPVLIRYY